MLKSLYEPKFKEVDDIVFLFQKYQNYLNNKNTFDNPNELELFLNHEHIFDNFENDACLDDEPFYDINHSDFHKAWKIAQAL